MNSKTLTTTLLCLFLFVSCSEESTNIVDEQASDKFCTLDNRFTEQDFFSADEIDSVTNETYGHAIDWKGLHKNLLIDAYFPKYTYDDMKRRPAILLMHGGDYQNGNKEQWRKECIEFAKKGYVAFTISYRLGWDTADDKIKAAYRANQDARAALRYIVCYSEKYGVDPNWLFIGGGSAGANNAFNVVYTNQKEWIDLLPDVEEELGELEKSTNHLANEFKIRAIFNNWGGTLGKSIQVEEMIPMIAFHGEQDPVVPIDWEDENMVGSRVIYNALKANGVCTDLTVKPNGGHGIYKNQEGIKFRVRRASCFFKSILCEDCGYFYAEEVIDAKCCN